MQTRLIELHQQRGRLQERIANQRRELALQMAPLQGVLAVPERVGRLVQEGKQFVVQHPLVLGTALASLLLFKPGFVVRWAGRGVTVWRTWRTVSAMLPGFVRERLRSVRK
ncbi:MAG: YqjK-like family protein [Rhodoferax sp.]|nr:YqjK-like family protein [Rhodoferax sp.]